MKRVRTVTESSTCCQSGSTVPVVGSGTGVVEVTIGDDDLTLEKLHLRIGLSIWNNIKRMPEPQDWILFV